MDRAMIVGQVMQYCKRLIENILESSDLQTVAAASLAILEQMREVARALLQAKVDLTAHTLPRQAVMPYCPEAALRYVHTRTVQPMILFGPITIPVRTFQCAGCGATQRPDDTALGVPPVGDSPMISAASTPHWWPHCPTEAPAISWRASPGSPSVRVVPKASSTAARRIIVSGASRPRRWQATRPPGCGWRSRWMASKPVSTDAGRNPKSRPSWYDDCQRDRTSRRDVCVLGAAEDLVDRIKAGIHEARWECIPIAEILGDGAAWIGNVATEHFRGIRQTLDYYHLSEHLYAFAPLLYPDAPEHANTGVKEKLAALLTDRVGEVLGARKRMRPRQPTVREGLKELLGYGENNRSRSHYKEPWHQGLAGGSGSVEGACKHVIQARFKRAGMRWKHYGFLNVLE